MAFDPKQYARQKIKEAEDAESSDTSFDPKEYARQKIEEHEKSSNPPSMLESLGAGTLNELSLGGAPKLYGAYDSPVGAGKSLLQLLGANYSGDEDVEDYEDAKKNSQEAFENEKKANPISYGAGQFLGGGALAAATGGVGEGASLAQKLLSAAKMGGAFGAAHGLASSEGDTLGQKLQDTATGGAVGAAAGPLTVGALEGVGGAVKTLAPKISTAFGIGKEGTNLLSKAGRRSITDTERSNVTDSISNKLSDLSDNLKKAYQNINDEYGNQEINGEEAIGQIKDLIGSLDDRIPKELSDKNTLTTLLNGFTGEGESTADINPTTTADDLLRLKRGFQDYSKYQSGMSSDQGQNIAGQATSSLGTTLKSEIPGLTEADSNYHNFQENVLNQLGIKNKNSLQTENKIRRLLTNDESDTVIGSNTRDDVSKAMESLKEINPDLAKDIQTTIENTSKRINVARSANNESFPTSGNVLSSAKGASLQVANALGQVSRVFTQIPKEALGKIGGSLSEGDSEIAQKLGSILTNASQKDDVGRNAIIYTLMQNDVYRNMMSKILGM